MHASTFADKNYSLDGPSTHPSQASVHPVLPMTHWSPSQMQNLTKVLERPFENGVGADDILEAMTALSNAMQARDSSIMGHLQVNTNLPNEKGQIKARLDKVNDELKAITIK